MLTVLIVETKSIRALSLTGSANYNSWNSRAAKCKARTTPYIPGYCSLSLPLLAVSVGKGGKLARLVLVPGDVLLLRDVAIGVVVAGTVVELTATNCLRSA